MTTAGNPAADISVYIANAPTMNATAASKNTNARTLKFGGTESTRMFKLNYLKKPKFKSPLLIAGFPGIANIAKVSVEYLISELKAEKFLELYSEHFPEWTIREEDTIKMLKVDFYHTDAPGRELILATADAQAATPYGQYALSDEFLGVAMNHGVRTIITMAAYLTSPHESRGGVLVTASNPEVLRSLREHGAGVLDGGVIVGMNGLLVGLAGARGLDGICILGATGGGLIDLRAVESILRVLSKAYGFKLNLQNLMKYKPSLPRFKFPMVEIPFGVEEEVGYIR